MRTAKMNRGFSRAIPAAGSIFSERADVAVTGRAVTDTTLYVVLVRQPGEPEAHPA
jgi:hypothetical protein